MLELWGVYQGCNEVLNCIMMGNGKVMFKMDGKYWERTLRKNAEGRYYVSFFGCKFVEAE